MKVLLAALLTTASHAGGKAIFRDGENSATCIMNGKNLELKGPSDGCITIDGKCVKGIFSSLQTEVDENVEAISQLKTESTYAIAELRADLEKQSAALKKATEKIQQQLVANLDDKLQRILACEDGKWANDAFTSLKDRCLPCHADCKHCSGKNHDQCTKCAGDRIFHENKCWEPCTCSNGTAKAGVACVQAIKASQGKREQCASCAHGFFVFSQEDVHARTFSSCHKSCSCNHGVAMADGSACFAARGGSDVIEQCTTCTANDFKLNRSDPKHAWCEEQVRDSCMAYYNAGHRDNKVYKIRDNGSKRDMYCRMQDGGGWALVVQIGNNQAHSTSGCAGVGCGGVIHPGDHGSKYDDGFIRRLQNKAGKPTNVRFTCAGNLQYFRGCSFHATRASNTMGGCTHSYHNEGGTSTRSTATCNAGSYALGTHCHGGCGSSDAYCRHCRNGPWYISNTGGCGHDCNGQRRTGGVWVR